MLREAFGAIPALEEEGVARSHLCERGLELPRLAREDERREPRKLLLDRGKRLGAWIGRDLLDGQPSPGGRRPGFRLRALSHGHFLGAEEMREREPAQIRAFSEMPLYTR